MSEPVVRNNLITPTGYRKLIEEVEFLEKTERPRIVEEVHFAARQGDRSENAEYQYGKKRLREIDKRLRFLGKRLETASIVDPREHRGDMVKFGAKVSVEEDDGKKSVYIIVGEDEIDLSLRKISWKSPVGRGLLNKKIGDWVEVEAPGRTRVLHVLDVTFDW